jgi:hypothetical protein
MVTKAAVNKELATGLIAQAYLELQENSGR